MHNKLCIMHMDWPSLLRQRRDLCKLTQTELAVRAGVSLPSIQNMEAGRANPSLRTLEKVFSIIGVKIEFTVEDKVKEFSDAPPPAPPIISQVDSAEVDQKIDFSRAIKEVSSELSGLTKGSALERASKLVKIFEKLADSKKS